VRAHRNRVKHANKPWRHCSAGRLTRHDPPGTKRI
jgi:hypothetical protein